jgi:hypothetical protein
MNRSNTTKEYLPYLDLVCHALGKLTPGLEMLLGNADRKSNGLPIGVSFEEGHDDMARERHVLEQI